MAAPMNRAWSAFIDQIKAVGFDGDGENFAAVVAWLKSNGHDTDTVRAGELGEVALKDLFDARVGKPLDISPAVQKAEEAARIDEQVREQVSAIAEAAGLGARVRLAGQTKGHHIHDVKVRDRIEDDPKGGYKSFGHFLADAAKAGKDDGGRTPELQRWAKASASTIGVEGTGVDGGFAVPPGYAETIMEFVAGEDSILARCDQFPTGRNSQAFPTDETTPWQSSGGIQTAWEGETGAYAQSKPELGLKELRLRKLTCLVPMTEELLEDAPAMGPYVTRKAGEKLEFAVGEAIFRGTGAGQPLGFLNSGSLISVAKETNQAADTVVGLNIIKMWSRMYAPYRREAVWFINQDVEQYLYRLSMQGLLDTGGTASTSWGTQLYVPPGGLSSAPYGTLMGRPVIATQHCNEVGDNGDVVLANMRQYICLTKAGGVESQSSIHLWFDQDLVAFKFRLRIDGQPWRNTTISPRDGSNTMSAFVAIAARA